jgi:hypothetical protein
MVLMRLLPTLAACVLAVLALGREAAAQPAAPPAPSATPIEMRLKYVVRSGTKACPKEQFFRDVVRAQLHGRDPFVTTAPKTVILTVRRVARGYGGTSKIEDAGRSLGETEEVLDDDCKNLVETMGHLVALAFTPIVRPAREAEPPPTPPAPPPEPAPSAPTGPTPQELPPEDPKPPPPPLPTPVFVRIAGAVMADRAAVSTWGLGFTGGIGARGGSFSGGVQARYDIGQNVTLKNGFQATVVRYGGDALVCWHHQAFRDVRMAACLLGEFGWIEESETFSAPLRAAHGALGPKLDFEVPILRDLFPGLFFRFGGEVLASLGPSYFAGNTVYFPRGNLGAGAGLLVEIPVPRAR